MLLGCTDAELRGCARVLAMRFLATRDGARDLPALAVPGFGAGALFLGRGPLGLEVVAYPASDQPSTIQLRELHHRRQAGRAAPVLVVVTHGHRRVALATRFGEDWSIHPDLDLAQAERLAAAALDAPHRLAADAYLRANLSQLDQPVPGVRNAGLFALHEIEHGVPARPDWPDACERARPMLGHGRDLLTALGYTLEATPGPVAILRAAGTRRAVAVFLDRPDEIEPANPQYDGLSPVSYALAKADAEHLDYVVVAAGHVLRIYPARPGMVTARRVGVVLPRSAFAAKGSTLFRKTIFTFARSVVRGFKARRFGNGTTRRPFHSCLHRRPPRYSSSFVRRRGWIWTTSDRSARVRTLNCTRRTTRVSWICIPSGARAGSGRCSRGSLSISGPRIRGSYYGWADPHAVVPALQDRRQLAASRVGSPFTEFPQDWAADPRTLPCHHARIAFRDVSRATDSRTVRVAPVPPRVVITNAAPYLLRPRGDTRDQAFLLGTLCSLPLDWYARRFVETHLNYFVFNPLPIPRPPQGSPLRQRVIALASRLAVANDDRFEEWGAAVGVTPSPLAEAEKEDLIHELDAAVAHLYGLSERDLAHIFETFHVGWDYQTRLDATLRHFRTLAGGAGG